jgi:glycosyltransferase involved in cell wall biosynthesis
MNSIICIVVPVYNEGNVLEKTLTELCEFNYRVVLVDDGSTDNSSAIASKFPVHLIRHGCNLGQGASLQTGITYALSLPETKIIVTFDSDGQHNPAQIQEIIDPILSKKVDVVLGSRFLNNKGTINIPSKKLWVLKLATFFTRITTRLSVTDTHNGFRALSRFAASNIFITQNGMAHASQILKQIHDKHLSYCEIPITITYSEYAINKGQSILNSINILWDSFFGGL